MYNYSEAFAIAAGLSIPIQRYMQQQNSESNQSTEIMPEKRDNDIKLQI